MRQVTLSIVAALIFVGVFLFQSATPDATVAIAPAVTPPFEISGLKADVPLYCQNEQCGRMITRTSLAGATTCPTCGSELSTFALGEKRILPQDTRIEKRIYTEFNGAIYLVSYVIGGTSKSSIHRPELCLPSQGYLMTKPESRLVAGRPWRVIHIEAPHGGQTGRLAYTFFNQEKFCTASHVTRILRDTLDRSVLNRVDRWVMVTVTALGATSNSLDYVLQVIGQAIDKTMGKKGGEDTL